MNGKDLLTTVWSVLTSLLLSVVVARVGQSVAFSLLVFVVTFVGLETVDRLNRISKYLRIIADRQLGKNDYR